MSDHLAFLLIPVPFAGHVNGFMGIAEQLRNRGHTVVFATHNTSKGKFEVQGFVEECYSSGDEAIASETTCRTPMDEIAENISKVGPIFALSSEQQMRLATPYWQKLLSSMKSVEPRLMEIVDNVKPDLIIVDAKIMLPALHKIGTPWVVLLPSNPIGISSENVPPPSSGCPTDGDRTLWTQFKNAHWETYKDIFDDYKNWFLEKGGSELKYSTWFHLTHSPFANIYMYPLELDYTDLRPNPPNWHRFDALVRSSDATFEIPEILQDLPGKLTYFSMGTIGSCELGVMRRLIGMLAKSPNRFIVSKGHLTEKLTLADNMWGTSYVPQTKVIPLVDLVITHGGNNTVTESFYFGKKVVVLPLFADQFDNGQRIAETGLGLQFQPYMVSEDDLLSAIETLLNDDLLGRRMTSISTRIQSTNSQSSAAYLVEEIAEEFKVNSS